jgi:hypothetical protein
MRTSILVAVVSAIVMLITRVLMGLLALASGEVSPLQTYGPVAVALLIVVGIIKGHRLAWQWGRVLGVLGGVLLLLMAAGLYGRVREQPGLMVVVVLLVIQGLPLFPLFFALGTRGAREHFGLVCPECGNNKPRAGNFFYTRAVCRECKTAWS